MYDIIMFLDQMALELVIHQYAVMCLFCEENENSSNSVSPYYVEFPGILHTPSCRKQPFRKMKLNRLDEGPHIRHDSN